MIAHVIPREPELTRQSPKAAAIRFRGAKDQPKKEKHDKQPCNNPGYPKATRRTSASTIACGTRP
jgi:hypothetical protein